MEIKSRTLTEAAKFVSQPLVTLFECVKLFLGCFNVLTDELWIDDGPFGLKRRGTARHGCMEGMVEGVEQSG